MPSQLAEELIQALNEEIDTLKNPRGRSRGGNIVKVFNGRFLREVSGLNVFVLNLENFLTALDNSPAEIGISGYRYSAQALLTQGLEVELGIERFSSKFMCSLYRQRQLAKTVCSIALFDESFNHKKVGRFERLRT